MPCDKNRRHELYGCALFNMGTTLNRQLNLTAREIEVCAMHFIDGRSQPLIADWLGVTLQCIRDCITVATSRQPALRKLRVKTRRPKIIHLSQISDPRDRDHGPFNVDEL